MKLFPKELAKNDKKAKIAITLFSIIIFGVITLLEKFKLKVDFGFNPHIFALISAVINSIVSVILVMALVSVKSGNLNRHRKLMIVAMYLSVAFLVMYVSHHLFAPSTYYGDFNHDGVTDIHEKLNVSNERVLYVFILSSHIILAALVMPLVLFASYRALTGDFNEHKKIVRVAYPIWLYVSITGVIVYLMISPFYN